MDDLIHANYLCDELGLDTISAGSVVAFAMECYERGMLTKEELGGLDLAFGNSEAIFELLRRIARREGFGGILAEGVKKASEAIGKGSDKFAMQVKGLEITGYDHRAAQAMALAYAVCDIGAHHNRAWAIVYDIASGRDTYGRDKVEEVIRLQHIRPLFDCLGVCRLPWVELKLKLELYADFYMAVTGVSVRLEDLLKASERIYNLTRALSLREGLAIEDWLAERDFVDPVPSGRTKGAVLDRVKFREMIGTYYKLRGWDEAGVPTAEKLRELGLDFIIPALRR
jgi:aldehyde:ferredoxin oxidoreductase